jgi:hypothetical protein
MATPDTYSSEYAEDVRNEVKGRIALADAVVRLRVDAVQTSRDRNELEQKRIATTPLEILQGSIPAEPLILISTSDARGYELLRRHENHLRGEQLAFIRFFTNDDGTTGHHFHLSPASEAMLSIVAELIEARRKTDREKP